MKEEDWHLAPAEEHLSDILLEFSVKEFRELESEHLNDNNQNSENTV